MDKPLKPYYSKNGKHFYRKGRLRMTVNNPTTGTYTFDGNVIDGEILIPEKSGGKSIVKVSTQK